MGKISPILWMSLALSVFSLILSGAVLYYGAKQVHLEVDNLSIVLSFVGALALFACVGNFIIVREHNKDFKATSEKMVGDCRREIEALKDLNRPPYLDILVKNYKDDKTLDEFKEEVYGVLNNYKGYRILDLHTFTKANFCIGTDLGDISNKLRALQGEYINRVDFSYQIALP